MVNTDLIKKPNHSNTLILTDKTLLHPENASPLAETLETLKEFVKIKNIENGFHSCLQILHFKSFRRIIMIFSVTKIADLVYDYFKKIGIKIGYARHDNKISHCDLDKNCDSNNNNKNNDKNSIDSTNKSSDYLDLVNILNNNCNNTPESSPIDERYPGVSVFQNINSSNNSIMKKLEPPSPPIQMQSPPPSPYEGWIERPEEPPSNTTIGFHPKTIGHLLYTYDNNNNIIESNNNDNNSNLKMKKVFSSVLEDAIPNQDSYEKLEDLDIGEGLDDDYQNNENGINSDNNKILHGSLFQNHDFDKNIGKKQNNRLKLKIPIVVVDTQEAENIKSYANQIDNIKSNVN